MFAKNFKISKLQLNLMLLFYLFNTTLLFLPSALAKINSTYLIFVTVFWGFISVLISALLVFFASKSKDFIAVDWYISTFGNFVGKIISCILIVSLLFFASLEIRVFSEIVMGYMLPKTPIWVIVSVVTFISFYCKIGGIEANARLAEILTFFVFVPLIIVIIGVALSVDFYRIMPINTPSLKELWQGGNDFATVFQGFFLLLFIFPFVKNNDKNNMFTIFTVLCYGIFVSIMVMLCTAIYGGELLKEKLFPTLQMLERISFQAFFLTRQDSLVIWFWFASTILFSSGMMLFSDISRKRLNEYNKNQSIIIPVIVFIFAILPRDLSAVYEMKREIVPWINALFLLILPIIILIIYYGKRGDKND